MQNSEPTFPVSRSPWRAAGGLLRADARDIFVIAVYATGVGLLSLTLPLAVQALVTTVAFGTLMQPIIVLALMLAVGLVFAASLRILQTWVAEVVQRRIFVRLVSAMAERLPRLHVIAFERAHGPELVNRFFDLFLAQKALSSLLLGGVEAVLTASVGLVVLAFYHPVLLGFGGFILVGCLVVFVLLGRGATKTTVKESKTKYAVAGWLEEMARHLFALKQVGGADFARTHLDRLATDWLDARKAHFRIVFRQQIGALTLQALASAVLLGIGGWLVIERELTIGQLVAAELIVTAVLASLTKLGGKLDATYDLIASADKLETLLTLPTERADGEVVDVPPGPIGVHFEKVTSRSGDIRAVSLDIEPGETVAVTGRWAERNAFVDLAFGLRAPVSGVVSLGGTDVRDLALESVRRRVAVVRTAEVLPGTIQGNLRAANAEASLEALWKALDAVGLGDVVRALPEGLRTELTATGMPLSPTGAMRLTVARAIVGRPCLLILDGVLEWLSPQDRSNLLNLVRARRTVVVATHDEVAAALCDREIALGGGA